VLFGFAVVNRYWLAPDLRGCNPAVARRRLIRSISLQTGFGLLIVLAAALLGQLRPGMDMSMQG
jgi:putative copper export protein